MILIIDNYDSFTYNLVQQVESLGQTCEVFYSDRISLDEIAEKEPEKIIISPGPGTPEDAGISNDVIKKFYKTTPILGVCLGHQCIGVSFGAKLDHAGRIMHGKTSRVSHAGEGLFAGIPADIEVARYHSWAIRDIKSPLKIVALDQDGTVMAIEHEHYPLYGVQFHPESFMTESGGIIMENFLK
ncbi:MAG TPA: aminodeoxychorismate/anthranilate synthase component II [Candidatus Saccharimonadales bacterium]|nr:aminodeoxychorismate/anthranilate synthase component II [Candidatus Saccharimonadales bacterium]